MTPNTINCLDTAAAKLPYAFLEAVAEHGEQALSEWLRKNAPSEIVELYGCWLAVKVAADGARVGDLRGHDSSLLEYVATVARGVTDLGGTWHGPTGEILTKTAAPLAVAGD